MLGKQAASDSLLASMSLRLLTQSAASEHCVEGWHTVRCSTKPTQY